jgi:hypothetical protein
LRDIELGSLRGAETHARGRANVSRGERPFTDERGLETVHARTRRFVLDSHTDSNAMFMQVEKRLFHFPISYGFSGKFP